VTSRGFGRSLLWRTTIMANGNKDGALYAIIGALALAVVGGGVYLFKQQAPSQASVGEPAPSIATAPAPQAITPPPAAPPVAAAPPLATPPIVPPSAAQARADQVRHLVDDARHMITRGDFAAADRALDQAERLDPRLPEVVAARRDLRDAQRNTARRDQRKDQRIDALVAQARAAIARRDYAAADRALDEAERIDGRDRDVQQARAELEHAKPVPSNRR